jgi:hypothetical protein
MHADATPLAVSGAVKWLRNDELGLCWTSACAELYRLQQQQLQCADLNACLGNCLVNGFVRLLAFGLSSSVLINCSSLRLSYQTTRPCAGIKVHRSGNLGVRGSKGGKEKENEVAHSRRFGSVAFQPVSTIITAFIKHELPMPQLRKGTPMQQHTADVLAMHGSAREGTH